MLVHLISYLGGIAQYTKGSQIESLLSNIPELKIILINSRIERNTLRWILKLDSIPRLPKYQLFSQFKLFGRKITTVC